jgi:phosphonate transport system permease protein
VDKKKKVASFKHVIKYVFWIAFVALFIYSFQTIMDLNLITNPKRHSTLIRILTALSKPNFHDAETRQIVSALMLETVQIGFLATTISAIFALPFTYFSARPSSHWGRGFNILLQPILSAIRSVHPLFISISTVVLAGLGPTAGVLALTLYSTSVLIGIFSEYAQEHKSLNWPILIKVCFPGLAFKQLPVNILIATILGFVGGGGIGFSLQQTINLLLYRDASVALIACIITIGSLDLLSRAVWRQIQKNI